MGNLFFYYWICDRSFKGLLIISVYGGISFIAALLMDRIQNEKARKLILFVSIVLVSTLLLLVKEWNIFVAFNSGIPQISWIAPVGMSFYTLQIISYIADVYMKRITAEKNIVKYFLFITYFPQIIQGPIPRYQQLADQLYNGHRFNDQNVVRGFMLIIWGFFLKLMIADKAGIIVNTVFNQPETYAGAFCLVAGVLYSIQLYSDFLAAVSIARGVSELFGIELVNNFDHPYFAISVKDFWRRWHISLSSWLRDYIYIPLGGNRKGHTRKEINILLTFAVSGIWHGSGYKYIFWGLVHGIYQVLGDVLRPVNDRLFGLMGMENGTKAKRFIQISITFFLVMMDWIIFRAQSLKIGVRMIISIFTHFNPWIFFDDSLLKLGLELKDMVVLGISIYVLYKVSSMQEKMSIREAVLRQTLVVRWSIYIGVIIVIMIYGTWGSGYDAQSFIYGGF